MISLQEIDHLAALARLAITPQEKEALCRDLAAILDYVAALKQAPTLKNHLALKEGLRNVLRQDVNPHQPAEFSGDLLAQAPKREGGYIKVKKIK